jgi:hypothetical protein
MGHGLAVRFVTYFEHNLAAGVMSRGLLLRGDRLTERQNLGHDRLYLPRVDELRDLCQI